MQKKHNFSTSKLLFATDFGFDIDMGLTRKQMQYNAEADGC